MNFQEGQSNQISFEMSALLQILLWAELEYFLWPSSTVWLTLAAMCGIWHRQMLICLKKCNVQLTVFLDSHSGFLQQSWLGILRVWTHLSFTRWNPHRETCHPLLGAWLAPPTKLCLAGLFLYWLTSSWRAVKCLLQPRHLLDLRKEQRGGQSDYDHKDLALESSSQREQGWAPWGKGLVQATASEEGEGGWGRASQGLGVDAEVRRGRWHQVTPGLRVHFKHNTGDNGRCLSRTTKGLWWFFKGHPG